MTEERIASRYVKSLFGLAEEQGKIAEVHNDMQLIAAVCDGSRDFITMLKNPIIKGDRKKAVLEKIFAGKVHHVTLAILYIVVRKKRECFLPLIAHQFHDAYNLSQGIQKAEVITVIPLEKTLRDAVEDFTKEYSGSKKVELTERIDRELIGGFVLNVGDRQMNNALNNQLKMLKYKLTRASI